MSVDRLADPFPVSQIHWRVGSTNKDKTSGMALAYLDSRDVMDRLDAVVGPDNWQSEHPWSDSKKLACRIGIRIGDQWVWKGDGAGDTAVEADKGAFSDALKRAAVSWGIGRYLYRCPNWWGDLEPRGRSYGFTKAAITKLNQEYDRWLMSDEGPMPGFIEMQKVVGDYASSIAAIKEGISSGEFSTASEEWFTLPDDVKSKLWRAPSKGGIFSSREIETMKTAEFRQSYYGTGEAA